MKKKRITLLSFPLILGILITACQPKNEPIKITASPHPDRIIVVIEENQGFGKIIGSEHAPYINQLAKKSALFTDAHGVIHPSQPNYLVLFSGNQMGISDDHCLTKESPFNTPNLAASLMMKGLTFKGYAQTMPSAGYMGCSYQKSDLTQDYLYARKHTPWVNWIGNGQNNIPDSISLPMSEFPIDFNKLPTVSFVIPNQDYDMHNVGVPGSSAAIKRGDEWLEKNIDPYVQWAETHNSLLILTFDEDDFTDENHIVTLFFGPMVKTGSYSERIDHYDVFQTIADLFQLPFTGINSGKVIEDIWKR